MTRIIVDDDLQSKLQNFTKPLELCDKAGRVLARVFPVIDPALYEPVEPQISDDELQRRRESTKWYTTAEVLAYLEKL
jgi:hypothetical protein